MSRIETIFGPAPPVIKGKMTRATPSNTQLVPRLPLHDLIHDEYLNLTLAMDSFWLNGNVFLHTKTRNINYRTVSAVSSCSASVIIDNLTVIRKMYESRGFTITVYEGDPEFDIAEVQQFALPATCNMTANDEHNGFIEESIRVVKERSWCITCVVPYQR